MSQYYFYKINRELILLAVLFIFTSIFDILINNIYLFTIKTLCFISNDPFGIKHDKKITKIILNIWTLLLYPNNNFNNIILVDNFSLYLLRFKVCSFIIFNLYYYIFRGLNELLDLLNNKTYNSKMKRYDKIYLKTDQIVIAVLMFCLLIFLYLNLMFYYLFFAFCMIFYQVIINCIEFIYVKKFCFHEKYFRIKKGFIYNILTGEYFVKKQRN